MVHLSLAPVYQFDYRTEFSYNYTVQEASKAREARLKAIVRTVLLSLTSSASACITNCFTGAIQMEHEWCSNEAT